VLQNEKLQKAIEISDSKQISLLNKWSDSVKSNTPLLMPCKGQEINSSNDLHSSKDKHTAIVHVHKWMIHTSKCNLTYSVAVLGNPEKISNYSGQYNSG
jgi:hypothetical protein